MMTEATDNNTPTSHAPDEASNITVTVRELQRNVAAVLKHLEHGETITVTRHGKTVATISPPDPAQEALNQAVADGLINPADLSRARTAAQTAASISREPASPEGDVASRALRELRDLEGDR